MVVTGLTLLFGGRADPGRVRAGGRAGVEGRLVLPPDSPVWARAADAGAEPDEDGSLILARTVSAEGRARAHLGGGRGPGGGGGRAARGPPPPPRPARPPPGPPPPRPPPPPG